MRKFLLVGMDPLEGGAGTPHQNLLQNLSCYARPTRSQCSAAARSAGGMSGGVPSRLAALQASSMCPSAPQASPGSHSLHRARPTGRVRVPTCPAQRRALLCRCRAAKAAPCGGCDRVSRGRSISLIDLRHNSNIAQRVFKDQQLHPSGGRTVERRHAKLPMGVTRHANAAQQEGQQEDGGRHFRCQLVVYRY